MQIPKNIFREYDIRGKVPEELNEESVYLIGRAIGSVFQRQDLKRIAVGRDNRDSSESLTKKLIQGLNESGCNVFDLGIVSLPMCHFATFEDRFDGSVCMTGSHNPVGFNGIKTDLKEAGPVYGEQNEQIYQMILDKDFEDGAGSVETYDISDEYLEYVASKFKLNRKVKVVLNCGNGATSDIAPKLLEKIGCDVIKLNCEFDSSFPKGVPDPQNQSFVKELADKVLETSADVGFVFDTDGDRIGMVDETGRAFYAEKLLLLLSDELLKEKPGSEVIYDIKSTQLLESEIKSHGGFPRIMRTGRSFFLNEMKESGAMLGGEHSGHIYIKHNYYGYDDGVYAACLLAEIISNSPKKVSEILDQYPERVSSKEFKVTCPTDERKFEIVADVVKNLQEDNNYLELITIDGVRAKVTETGWFLIRASNTNPYLSIRAEGNSEKELQTMLDEVNKILSEYPELDTTVISVLT